MKWLPPSFSSKISSWASGIWFAIQAIDFQGMRLTPRDRESRERVARNDVAPMLTSMIKEQSGDVLAGHAQGALDDPFLHILRTISRHTVFDESADGCLSVWTTRALAVSHKEAGVRIDPAASPSSGVQAGFEVSIGGSSVSTILSRRSAPNSFQ